jgi:hypothetical protein
MNKFAHGEEAHYLRCYKKQFEEFDRIFNLILGEKHGCPRAGKEELDSGSDQAQRLIAKESSREKGREDTRKKVRKSGTQQKS